MGYMEKNHVTLPDFKFIKNKRQNTYRSYLSYTKISFWSFIYF